MREKESSSRVQKILVNKIESKKKRVASNILQPTRRRNLWSEKLVNQV